MDEHMGMGAKCVFVLHVNALHGRGTENPRDTRTQRVDVRHPFSSAILDMEQEARELSGLSC